MFKVSLHKGLYMGLFIAEYFHFLGEQGEILPLAPLLYHGTIIWPALTLAMFVGQLNQVSSLGSNPGLIIL